MKKFISNLNGLGVALFGLIVAVVVFLILTSLYSSKANPHKAKEAYICVYDVNIHSFEGSKYVYRFTSGCDSSLQVIFKDGSFKLFYDKFFVKDNVYKFEVLNKEKFLRDTSKAIKEPKKPKSTHKYCLYNISAASIAKPERYTLERIFECNANIRIVYNEGKVSLKGNDYIIYDSIASFKVNWQTPIEGAYKNDPTFKRNPTK